jgi:serine/threonine protein kinase
MPTGEEWTAPGRVPVERPVHENETVIPDRGAEPVDGPLAAGNEAAPGGVADVDEFSRALVDVGLIGALELATFAVDSYEGVLDLSRALVKAGKLTPYQAAAVYQKKSRGLLIGNYLILDKLGQGGMGVVFKARHRLLGRVGALKILPPSFARDRDAVLRFRREVEAAGRLKHPNLVAAQDADEDRGVHFLVMDYVEGRDLDRIVRERGPMPVVQAIDCLIQAARGLEAAHAQGIIHRDIKPGNLMLENSGTVRVLDLGLARIVDAANPFSKTAAGRLTQSGMYMGTIDYMAPEQAEDSHRVDHRVDIYSLGCTIFYLLTGREPFPGETVLKRLIAHMMHPAPSLRSDRPGIHAAVEAAYQKMMAKRPEDRPASMTEVIALLEACKVTTLEASKSQHEIKVFNEPLLKRAGEPKTVSDSSVFAVGDQRAGVTIEHDLKLEDLVMDLHAEARPAHRQPVRKPEPAQARPLARSPMKRSRGRQRKSGVVLVALLAALLLVAAGAWYIQLPSRARISSDRFRKTELSVGRGAGPAASTRSPKERPKSEAPPNVNGKTGDSVLTAMPNQTQTLRGKAALIVPANPSQALVVPPTSPVPTAATKSGAAIPTRPLPKGFQANPDAGFTESGWPLVIVGDHDDCPMVLVPGGTFFMGSRDGEPAEAPEHQVRLSTYYIDQHEVTNRQFRKFLRETHHKGQPPGKWLTDADVRKLHEDLPVVHVNMRDVESFAAWAGKTIPTEAQWELAARSTKGRRYPWGDSPPNWSKPRAYQQIDRVMMFPEDMSPYGVFDMAGNAEEWTKDWFDPNYYHVFTTADIAENPTGPKPSARSPKHVVRGASKNWSVTYREGVPYDRRLRHLGFRCVLAVE